MTTFELVTSLSGPRVHEASKREASLIRTAAAKADVLVIELAGNRMRTLDGLFGEYAQAFAFRGYFGWNWAAFDECLYDLGWLPARSYLTIISDGSEVLSQEPEELETYMRVIGRIGQAWSTSVGRGYEWGHGELPFHTILVK
ncbi:barstar family protein [Arthrobacter rhizosphaerae]|uniref:barstar family protein n=1 Tax=Arthrobacter rhizosphaerae TaxID=2855490 RepID=UPI001FF4C647|nr:barstar family protein [Arthrobacter rhizosphaerae]